MNSYNFTSWKPGMDAEVITVLEKDLSRGELELIAATLLDGYKKLPKLSRPIFKRLFQMQEKIDLEV